MAIINLAWEPEQVQAVAAGLDLLIKNGIKSGYPGAKVVLGCLDDIAMASNKANEQVVLESAENAARWAAKKEAQKLADDAAAKAAEEEKQSQRDDTPG